MNMINVHAMDKDVLKLNYSRTGMTQFQRRPFSYAAAAQLSRGDDRYHQCFSYAATMLAEIDCDLASTYKRKIVRNGGS